MNMEGERPRIRPGIEALPAVQQGRRVVLIRDRWGISPDLVLDQGSALILSLMDGRNDLREIQVMLMRSGGFGLVSTEELRGFIKRLDDQYLLDNERFRSRREELLEEFRKRGLREAAHAGSAYPADPRELHDYLDELMSAADEKGPAQASAAHGPPVGLVLPHIDLERGGRCYARGYKFLRPFMRELELLVILGTSHLPMELPMALTRKDFQTPLGAVPCAGELADEICELSCQDFYAEELVHRAEHSIEVQVVFLKYLAGEGRCPFRILPVLCGGFHHIMEKAHLPSAHSPLWEGIRAMQKVIGRFSGRSCVIASADLAHLGPQFGDPRPVDVSDLGRIERQDLAMLQWVVSGSPDGFYRHIMAEEDRRRICGLPPIYAWLHLVQGRSVQLIDYCQAHHPQCTVTFASLGAW
jgi:AmmeMemoRadiSam system protein B